MKKQILILAAILLSSSSLVFSDEQCSSSSTNDLIDDCNCRTSDLRELNNQRLYPLLRQLVSKNYFRFFPVNLRKKCLFWSDEEHCSRSTCAIKQCRIENLPEPLRDKVGHSQGHCATVPSNSSLGSINKNISEKHQQTINTWIKFDDDQSENFCDVDDETSADLEYIDLLLNLERYTGYSGPSTQRVWSAIYNENCFFLPDSKIYYDLRQKRLNAHKMCLEGRTFYRLISGLHTSITVHLCAQYFYPVPGGGYTGSDGRWGPNFDEFHRRFAPEQTEGEGPKWLKNIYFIYLIELRAIYKARDFFKDQTFFTGNETDDVHTKELFMNQFIKEIEPYASYFNEHNLFQNGNELLKVEFKEHFRNISRIMDCVGCDKCKLWGKLQVQALGTALKILFTEHPIQLQRSEIVSLINGFNRLSTSIHQLETTFKSCTGKNT